MTKGSETICSFCFIWKCFKFVGFRNLDLCALHRFSMMIMSGKRETFLSVSSTLFMLLCKDFQCYDWWIRGHDVTHNWPMGSRQRTNAGMTILGNFMSWCFLIFGKNYTVLCYLICQCWKLKNQSLQCDTIFVHFLELYNLIRE